MNYLNLSFILFWTITGITTSYIAKQRNRNPIAWFFVGLFFSLFGLLLLLALPSKAIPAEEKEEAKVPDIKTMHSDAAALSDGSMYNEPSIPRISRDSQIDWYYIDSKAKITGPLKLPELRKALIEAKMDAKTYIWCEEYLDWTQIFSIQNGESLLDPDFL
jgi:hypothetical protein